MNASDEEPETWAFRLVWIAAAVLVVCVVVGVVVSVVLGIVLLVLTCVGAVAWVTINRSPDRSLRDAELAGEARAPVRGDRNEHARILLVANRALDERAIDDALAGTGADATIDVLAPVLQSRTHLVMTDVDAEMAAARERLDTTLASARHQGFRASGRVGDPVDPLTGLQDELRLHAVSEVVVATHPDADENWLEPSMIDELRAQLGIPVRQVVVRG